MPGGHFYVERLHWPSGARAEITVLDAGAGAAVHLRALHRDWLLDAGSERDYNRVGREYLRSRGIDRLDGLLLTHGDAGHIGGAAGVLRDFHPRELLDTAATDRSASHRALITLLNSQSINRRFCAAGDELRLSRDVAARVLFPPKDYEGNTTDDQAIVTEIAVAGKPRMLLMSDSGDVTEKLLLRSGIDLHSDIVIKGQHHSGTSCSPEFLDAVRPQVIIATSRDFPESERIKDDWAELLRSRGIALFRQDETGAVRVLLFRDHWEIKSFLTAQSLRSTSR